MGFEDKKIHNHKSQLICCCTAGNKHNYGLVTAGTVGLPSELQRLLKTIQDLDERSQGACIQGMHFTAWC